MTARELLLLHAKRYPKAEPSDLLKLAYQAAYGPGHLISDLASAVDYIVRESATAPSSPYLTEPIGGGYVRLYLGAARDAGISPEEIAQRLVAAAERAPDPALFDAVLGKLFALTASGCFAFSVEALAETVAKWEAAGRPLFRHSEAYRTAYAPAYRVIMEESCS